MSKNQRSLEKKKQRQKEIRKKLLNKKEKFFVINREAKQDFLKEKRIKKIQKELEKFDQVMEERELMAVNEGVLQQLEKNIKILKTLESEYEQDRNAKDDLNKKLEDQGYYTLEEKMQAIREHFKDQEHYFEEDEKNIE